MIIIISAKGKLSKRGSNHDTVFVVNDEEYIVSNNGDAVYVNEKIVEDTDTIVPASIVRPGIRRLTIPGNAVNFILTLTFNNWSDLRNSIDWDFEFGTILHDKQNETNR